MSFSIIVPVYNDEHMIQDKINDIMSITYDPNKVEIIIVIGGKHIDDITVVSRLPLVRIIRTKSIGKINQLNKAFKIALGDVYVVSDVDATVSHDCLNILERILKNKRIGCVGGFSYINGFFIDRWYWIIANYIRLFEYKFYSSSHVVAPFYAFRKNILKNNSICDDVVADDVYIATETNIKGYIVAIDKHIKCIEKRSPKKLIEFINHKTRKGNAVLKELLRAIYKFNYMPNKYKIIYLLRLFQFTILTPSIPITYPFIKQGSCYEKVSS